jgi:Cu(I)/Ag(I) efflux system membrane fusion protein
MLNRFISIPILTLIIGFLLGMFFSGNKLSSLDSLDPMDKEWIKDAVESSAYPNVKINPNVVHNLGIRFAKAEKKSLLRNIETIGKITRVDSMARRTVTSPLQGTLTYLIDKQDGDFLKQGDLLFRIASDDLFKLQKEFQEAYSAEDTSAAIAMIPHLHQMGLNDKQIVQLKNGETPEFPVEVYASEDNYIFTRSGFVGEFINSGFALFNVGSQHNIIEVTAEIFERQWGWVEVGQTALMTVRGLPGLVFEGSVVRVNPPVGYPTRSLETTIRFNIDNPAISQSMFTHVSILGRPKENVILVPQTAVIRTEHEQRVVLLLDDGSYQPVVVEAGEEANGMVEILSGLQESAIVVTSGQFLIDSESNMLVDFNRMLPIDDKHSQHINHHSHH